MNRCGEETESGEEQREGNLEDKRENGGNLKKLPHFQTMRSKVTDSNALLRHGPVDVEVFAEPLLDQHTKGGCRKTQY